MDSNPNTSPEQIERNLDDIRRRQKQHVGWCAHCKNPRKQPCAVHRELERQHAMMSLALDRSKALCDSPPVANESSSSEPAAEAM